MVGGEVAMKCDNNLYFGGLEMFWLLLFVFNKKLTLAIIIPFCTEILRIVLGI